MVFKDVAIVGVGLIGGSIGMRLVADGACRRVIGVGWRHTSLRLALDTKAIHEATLDAPSAAARSDLVIIATSVGLIPSMAERIMPACRPGTVVTDVGSIKGAIVRAVQKAARPDVEFVGAHPMAGSEKRGVAHAQADLFENALCILTPLEGKSTPATEKLRAFWGKLGARVTVMDPGEHDRLVATISHLPHCVAAAVVASIPDDALKCTGQGFRDTTRIASGDADLWTDILIGNRDQVLASLRSFDESVSILAGAIERGDRQAVRDFLDQAGRKRGAVDSALAAGTDSEDPKDDHKGNPSQGASPGGW